MDELWSGNLVSDRYFKDKTGVLSLDVRSASPSTKIEIRATDLESEKPFLPHNVQSAIEKVSQFGQKEVWLGQTPGDHNRWQHTIGVFNAGFIWLRVLEDDNRVPDHCLIKPFEDWPSASADSVVWKENRWKVIRRFAEVALLLHDYGHLPFSHLIEEVLASMNWIPHASGAAGLEAAVLKNRLEHSNFNLAWSDLLDRFVATADPHHGLSGSDMKLMVEDMIFGRCPSPWIQAIINSPIDADKIDYIRFDSEFLDQTHYPLKPRLLSGPNQWLEEFLRDQSVNHAGILCLHGRSAVAAADLWRERIFLYDRLYLSPELRVPDRIAFEIIKLFIVRSTMSSEIPGSELDSYPMRMDRMARTNDIGEVFDAKYNTARDIMIHLLRYIEGGGREWKLLEKMNEWMKGCRGIDEGYKTFLTHAFQILVDLKTEKKTLHEVVNDSLVDEPLLCDRADYTKIRDILRPLQHAYCREVLIDVVSLPRVLSAPQRWRTGFGSDDPVGVDYRILVPDGRISTWGSKSRAARPLTDECVVELERPFCRIIVIAPEMARSSRSAYVRDRVRSTLIENNVKIMKDMKDPL